MKISVSLQGVQALRAKIARLRANLSDLRPALVLGAIEVLDDAQFQFSVEGDPPWAPKKQPNGLPLLVRTGSLKQSLQAAAQDAVVDIPGGIRVGTNLEYASYQQFGVPKNEAIKRIPARPFLWRDPDTLGQKIRAVFAAYIVKGV